MKNTVKHKFVWGCAALLFLSVAFLISQDGVARHDWIYMAALPAVIFTLWLQYRQVFGRKNEDE